MIAVDASAPVEAVLDRPSARARPAVLEGAEAAAVSAGTPAEALVVAGRRGVARRMERPVRGLGMEAVPVPGATARGVSEACARRGEGVHPAALNSGDRFAHALAGERACGLPFAEKDFSRTDVEALPPMTARCRA